MRVLVIGCGYVGKSLAGTLAAQGHEVVALSRGLPADLPAPVAAVACDITRPDEIARLPADFERVVNTVSSTKGGVDEYRAVYLEGTRHLLDHLQFQKYVFTSSTSVYAQNDGTVVTEASPAEPQSPTSRILREAEELLLRSGRPAIVLRVGGIYGPDRGALFMQYLRRDAIIRGDGHRFLNMAHRDDVAGAVIASLERGRAGEIYNVVDNQPVTEAEFFEWLENQLRRGFQPPHIPEGALADRKRGITNKQVSNKKLREQLAYRCKFPTFREGYTAEIERLRAAGLLR
jgi:nucleoside-diphosphate-sugar epimerase